MTELSKIIESQIDFSESDEISVVQSLNNRTVCIHQVMRVRSYLCQWYVFPEAKCP